MKVAFRGQWKESLGELSGGMRIILRIIAIGRWKKKNTVVSDQLLGLFTDLSCRQCSVLNDCSHFRA